MYVLRRAINPMGPVLLGLILCALSVAPSTSDETAKIPERLTNLEHQFSLFRQQLEAIEKHLGIDTQSQAIGASSEARPTTPGERTRYQAFATSSQAGSATLVDRTKYYGVWAVEGHPSDKIRLYEKGRDSIGVEDHRFGNDAMRPAPQDVYDAQWIIRRKDNSICTYQLTFDVERGTLDWQPGIDSTPNKCREETTFRRAESSDGPERPARPAKHVKRHAVSCWRCYPCWPCCPCWYPISEW